MKVTGIIVAAIGLLIVMFAAAMGMRSQNAPGVTDMTGEAQMLWPMAVGVTAMICGGLIAAFGGRGYFIARSPAVRN
jgi:hypothetical protein